MKFKTSIPTRILIVVALQWVTTIMALFLVSQQWSMTPRQESPSNWVAPVVFFFSIVVSFRLLYRQGWRRQLTLLELTLITAIPVGVVSGTGWWQSPYVFVLLASVVLAAYTVGLLTTIIMSGIIILVVSVPYYVLGGSTGVSAPSRAIDSVRWAALLSILAVTSSYATKFNSQNGDPLVETGRTIEKLKNVNRLLLELHGETQSMQLSFDEEDIVDSIFRKIRPLVPFDAGVVFANKRRDTSGEKDVTWTVLKREGITSIASSFSTPLLPQRMQAALAQKTPLLFSSGDANGFATNIISGIYTPLMSQGKLIGGLALETSSGQGYEEDDIRIVQGIADALALAIENARWFQMIKTVGADEERNRIARDLHDSLGQSLAYLLMSSDNLALRSEGTEAEQDLTDFSGEVRLVIGDMRDALYDLRTNVDNEKGFSDVVRDYADRVAERSNISVTYSFEEDSKLPLLQEKEMWRIAQEAILNAEKHSECKSISILWECNDTTAKLVVEDDGKGMEGDERRFDSYGIIGMSERAEAIGATLTIESTPSSGCRLICVKEY